MMTKTRQRQLKPDPLKIPDPLELFPDPMRRWAGDERASSNGMTFNASIAAGVSPQGATAGGDTVATPAGRPNTASGDNPNPSDTASGDASVTPTNTKRHTTVTPTVTHCEHCGAEFVAHRPWARFCGAYCRRRAWLDRNPERAAELHERDIARLREHVIGNGGAWVEGAKVR